MGDTGKKDKSKREQKKKYLTVGPMMKLSIEQ